MDKPLLSICIPTYNRAEYLKRCILSALKVKSREIEIFVSDNGSEDDTWSVLKNIKDGRLRFIRNEKNLGFARNLVKVVEEALGAFVFLMSDEDTVNAEYIDDLIVNKISKFSDLGLVYGSIFNLDKSAYYYKYKNGVFDGAKAFKKFALTHSYMSGMLLLKESIDFEKLHSYIQTEKHFFYPHEVMALIVINSGYKAIAQNDICSYMRTPLKTFIADEGKYYHHSVRLETFEQYLRIVADLKFNEKYYRIVQQKVALGVAGSLISKASWDNTKKIDMVKAKVSFLKKAIKLKGVNAVSVLLYIFQIKFF